MKNFRQNQKKVTSRLTATTLCTAIIVSAGITFAREGAPPPDDAPPSEFLRPLQTAPTFSDDVQQLTSSSDTVALPVISGSWVAQGLQRMVR
jgi:hypothetical protein